MQVHVQRGRFQQHYCSCCKLDSAVRASWSQRAGDTAVLARSARAATGYATAQSPDFSRAILTHPASIPFHALVNTQAATRSRSSRCRMAKEEKATEDGEKGKTKPPAWMFNEDGVAYAPWMVDAFDPEVGVRLLRCRSSRMALLCCGRSTCWEFPLSSSCRYCRPVGLSSKQDQMSHASITVDPPAETADNRHSSRIVGSVAGGSPTRLHLVMQPACLCF